MASDNQWALDLESTVVSLVKSKVLAKLQKKYKNIKITDEGESDSTAVFPTVYIHLLSPVEWGQTLDGQDINAIMATFQIDVTANTNKSDCRYVMSAISDVFKTMRFDGTELPECTLSNGVHRNTARFKRIIGANDKLL